jgi:hypothetical protein
MKSNNLFIPGDIRPGLPARNEKQYNTLFIKSFYILEKFSKADLMLAFCHFGTSGGKLRTPVLACAQLTFLILIQGRQTSECLSQPLCAAML